MQLNIKIIKKWQTPPPPPFSGLSTLSSKLFGTPPQVTQVFEGPTPPFNKGEGGGFNYGH